MTTSVSRDPEWESKMAYARGKRSSLVTLADPLLQLQKVASKYYKCLDTPIALSCFLLLKYGEYDQLVSKSINPLDYNAIDIRESLKIRMRNGHKYEIFYYHSCRNVDAFRNDYAATKFLSKCKNLPTTYNLELNALTSEVSGEKQCGYMNSRMEQSRILRKKYGFAFNTITERALPIIRAYIKTVLGRCPSLDEIAANVRFGPGASSATTGFDTTTVAKIGSKLHVSSLAQCDLAYVVQLRPMLSGLPIVSSTLSWTDINSLLHILDHSTWTTAPKNAKTARGISTQIHGNMLGQLALGSIIRERCKKARRDLRFDLNTLASMHQYFAYIGSIDGSYTTKDVTNASSTIAREVVWELFPRGWAILLDRWRDHYTDYKGEIRYNEKFSAMGCGFTFELESVLFAAIAYAACKISKVKGYSGSFGDDVIIPTAASDNFDIIMNSLGFVINETKSFSTGYFRESCGGDYFDGVDVKPIFCRDLLYTDLDLVKLANRIRRFSANGLKAKAYLPIDAKTISNVVGCDKRFRPVWNHLVDGLKNSSIGIGSIHFGDQVLWANESDGLKLYHPLYSRGLWISRLSGYSPRRRRYSDKDPNLHAWFFEAERAELKTLSFLRPPYDVGLRVALQVLSHRTVKREPVSLPLSCRGVKIKLKQSLATTSELSLIPNWV